MHYESILIWFELAAKNNEICKKKNVFWLIKTRNLFRKFILEQIFHMSELINIVFYKIKKNCIYT